MKDEKVFSIKMICGTPFNGYEDEAEKIRDIIENELQRWPVPEEYETIAARVGDRPSRIRMLVGLMKQQARLYDSRKKMFKGDNAGSSSC